MTSTIKHMKLFSIISNVGEIHRQNIFALVTIKSFFDLTLKRKCFNANS